MVFHCIFRHFAWRGAGRNIGAGYSAGENNADSEKTIEERLRDLSCDIAVEHIIDGMNYRSTVSPAASCAGKPTVCLKKKEKP